MITLTFTPKAALKYRCVAYCSVVGQEERLPLLLSGQGIGPKAAFSWEDQPIDEIFVESAHQYTVDLINQGDIAVTFKLVPNNSQFGSKFHFSPSEGRLEVGEKCEITIDFVPDLLGHFQETFRWDLVGSAASLALTFTGKSVPPTFTFDVDRIAFGVVSYGYLNSKTLTLTNTSEVPMRFALRIPGDGRFAQKEFDVIPPRGMLYPNCSQKVQLDFISVNIKTYDLALVMDLDGVGQELASIPIQARCAVPMVKLDPPEQLQFGDIFIRYPSNQTISLSNTSALPAKFQILPQDEVHSAYATIQPDQAFGSVPPASSHVITLTLTAHKIGQLQFPIFVRMLGHASPYQLMVVANSTGPIVTVEPPVLDFGSAKCLEPVTRQVKITNACVIDAQIKALMKLKNSLWTVSPKDLLLKPFESVTAALTLTCDEAAKVSDTLYLVVNEGKDVSVSVKAQGVASPVTCKERLDEIDFGTQYTTQTITREFLIENRGTRQRKLVWSHEAEKIVTKNAPDPIQIFNVSPMTLLMDGKTAYKYEFTAVAHKQGLAQETLVCHEYIGNDRKGKVCFRCALKGNFVSPLLTLSATTLNFKYLWSKGTPPAPMSQKLRLTNVSLLDVEFTVKVAAPFKAGSELVSLKPNETTEVHVEFDPGFKVDRQSSTVKQKLIIVYQDHPQKDTVHLVGEVAFPNVVLSLDKLDFGAVLNDTTKQLSITMSNPHVLPVSYHWMFVEDQEMAPMSSTGQSEMPVSMSRTSKAPFDSRSHLTTTDLGAPQVTLDMVRRTTSKTTTTLQDRHELLDEGSTLSRRMSQASAAPQWQRPSAPPRPEVDINQIFDILPIMGTLEPGASQTTTFTYFGLGDRKFSATALCQAEGGPEYEVRLRGQASRLEFKLDKTDLDFGELPYSQVSEKEVYLSNTGKVAYYFSWNLTGLSRNSVLDISPASGLINPKEGQKMTVRFRCGIPDEVCEQALLEVAHFEPTRFTVRGRGVFPGVLLSTPLVDGVGQEKLPRFDSEEHEVRRAEALERLRAQALSGNCAALRQGDKPDSQTQKQRKKNAQRPALDAPEPTEEEVESEADRRYLCQVLLEKEREVVSRRTASKDVATKRRADSKDAAGASMASARPVFGTQTTKSVPRSMAELPTLTAAYYTCDFGHLVLGQSGRRVVCALNCYSEPISFTINKKLLASQGFTISPEKVKRLPPGRTQKMEVICFRSKGDDEGVQELDWAIPIKGGPCYEVKLRAHFVLPEVTLSSEEVDFGRVLVGQVKRMCVRLRNTKTVPVEWEYKIPKNKFGKPLPPWETPYTLAPASGKMQPGGTQFVTIAFMPSSSQLFHQKLPLKISDNPNTKLISLRGHGDSLHVEVEPSEKFQLGPVLPGDDECTREFFLHNPTDYPIEVYCVDFDQKFAEEEEMLNLYDQYNSYNMVELPLREPGSGTWSAVVKYATKRQRQKERERLQAEREKERKRLRTEAQALNQVHGDQQEGDQPNDTEADEEKAEEEEEEEEEVDDEALDEVAPEEQEMDPADFPLRVPTGDRLNVILVGPPLSGKTVAAQALAAKDGRKVLSIDEVVDWARSGPASLNSQEDKDLTLKLAGIMARDEELHEQAEQQREKDCKKAKTPFVKQPVQNYSFPVEDVAWLIKKRAALPDCNCGVVFDGFDSKYLPSIEASVEAVLTALSEKLVVVGIGLDCLGFSERAPLGVNDPALGALAQDGPETEEALQRMAAAVRGHLPAVKEQLQGRQKDLEGQLQLARDSLAALGDPPPPAGQEGGPAPAQPCEGVPAEDQAHQESGIDAQREAQEKLVTRLTADMGDVSARLAQLTVLAEKKQEGELASKVLTAVLALDKLAVKANEDIKAAALEAAPPARSPRSSPKFSPPGRQEESRPVSAEPSSVMLVPVAMSSEGFFEVLKADIQAAVPAPIIPAEPPLPTPSLAQVVSRPQARPRRVPPENFQIITPPDDDEPPPQEFLTPTDKDGKKPGKPGSAQTAASAAEARPESKPSPTRWLLQPHERRRLLLKFFSQEVGTFTHTLAFEVVGGTRGKSPVSLAATGVTDYPKISGDPRNVFMRRVKTKPPSGYANKQYIASLGVYDFGPLLAGRDRNCHQLPEQVEGKPRAKLEKSVERHIETLRVTNNSLFKAKVRFSFSGPDGSAVGEPARATPVEPKAKAKGAAAKEPKKSDIADKAKESVFSIEPQDMELDIDETREVKLCCFPAVEGSFSDTLVATVENNPVPVEFAICAIGAVPKVNLDTNEVDFDRLLLKQKATESLKLANVCAVPVKWRLKEPANGLPLQFDVEPMEGTLAVAEEQTISVTFQPEDSQSHNFLLKLQIGDVEDLKPLEDTHDIKVAGEGYQVDVVPEIPGEGCGLDFDAVRVGSAEERTFNVVNNGKYPVRYEVKVPERRKALRDMLEIETAVNEDGVALLEPGQKKQVKVKFMPLQEMQCPDPRRPGRKEELELLVFEAKSGEPVQLERVPIALTFQALYNSFSITPPRGLNFGPVRTGAVGQREFEIHNDGIFKLDWSLFDSANPPNFAEMGDQQAAATASTQVASAKGGKADKGALPTEKTLTIGPFRMTPLCGELKPKESAKIRVDFTASEDKHFDCKIGIHVDGMPDRPPASGQKTKNVEPAGQTRQSFFNATVGGFGAVGAEVGFREYLLTGQSCTPGIETDNVQSIFEEQFVARSLEDAIATSGRVDIRAFCEEDRFFSFGPVVVTQGSSSGSDSLESAKFRISNPKAIPCDVKFEIKPRGTPGKDQAFPFDLSTNELHIPPHEYRYIKVRFRPTALQSFVGNFKAEVVDGRDPGTNSLSFEVRGEGTVPTISLGGPPLSGDTGSELHVGRLQAGKTHSVDFVLTNDGVIPATARCDYPSSAHFTVGCPRTLTLEPKAQHPFQVHFHPTEAGNFKIPLRLSTLHNPYEDRTINVEFSGCKDAVAWELPDAAAQMVRSFAAPAYDQVNLGAVPLGGEATVMFSIMNTSKDTIRFQFPEKLPAPFSSGGLLASPSVGHVLPGASKPITFVFRPTEKLSAQGLQVPVSIASIKHDGEPEDWDDSMRVVSFGDPDAVPGNESMDHLEETVPEEPPHHMISGSQHPLPIHVTAMADAHAYECSTQMAHFSATVLFQRRVHRFHVKNPSTIPLPFDWRVVGGDGSRAYSVEPAKGSIAGGTTQEFALRFAPTEVEDFACQLECQIPHLSAGLPPLAVALSGSALRPWCHFELPESSYRSRRRSDVPLDPKYSIIEFESLGTHVKNTKRFYVCNPTSEQYEFAWRPEEFEKKGDQDDCFRCLSKRGTVLPGKKHEIIFEYVPTTVGTHEMFWTFSIAGKSVTQSFVLVGSVKDPRVGTDRPSVNFGRLLVGGKATEVFNIVNKEHIPFSFSLATSCQSESHAAALSVSPMSGVVGPGNSFPIQVTFAPTEEVFYNFNIIDQASSDGKSRSY
ncbi:unnamed protein product [Prorocentrum cordatum]|uniref:MSP domain-containing protein n=1 Tax=Prorocentrum cordatum TaxID=2364126 RepID=A0ABN9S0Z7_9DINO|nr:unnamed protein product [Polarella glacialis]